MTDDLRGKVGAKVNVRTEKVIDAARDIIADEPSTSTRRLTCQLDISRSAAAKILRMDIALFPYKIQTLQFIPNTAISQRWDFTNEILDLIDTGILSHKKIWFSDEAHFWLSDQVNRQNYRFWESSKNEFVTVRPLHPRKVTVWAVLCGSD